MSLTCGLTNLYACELCLSSGISLWVRVMMLNSTFNNISVLSWWSVLLVEEIGVPGENHRPGARHWQTLSHKLYLGLYLGPLLKVPIYSRAVVVMIVLLLDLQLPVCNQCLSPLTLWVRITLIARCTRYNLCDNVCQWRAPGRWFSPGTPI
jgi:hypothetical protein